MLLLSKLFCGFQFVLQCAENHFLSLTTTHFSEETIKLFKSPKVEVKVYKIEILK